MTQARPTARRSTLMAAWLPLALASNWLGTSLAQPAAAQTAADGSLAAALANPTRSPRFAARDSARHPAETLGFLGLRSDASVVEIWPGGGYWSEILGPYLAAHGTYYLAMPDGEEGRYSEKLLARLHADPVLSKTVKLTVLSKSTYAIAPAGSADFVLTFRNLHNWMAMGITDAVLAEFHRVLKPGGVLGVEDHRGDPAQAQDPKAEDGYVRQDVAIKMIEKAGFTFAGSSEINANPRDTRHWPQGVWTLPPTYALGDKDRAKYAKIGEADNFLLKFTRNP